MSMIGRGCWGGGRQRAASALELSILGPAMLALVWSVIQMALYLFASSMCIHAADYGASYVRVFPEDGPHKWNDSTMNGPATRAIETQANNTAGNLLKKPTATVHYNRNGDDRVTVIVTGHPVTLVGFDLTVTRQVTAPIEKFRPDCGTDCPNLEGIGGG